MKIDIDLSEIFDEESGDVDASVKDVIISTVTQKIYAKIEKSITGKLDDILSKGIKEKLDSLLAELIPSLMDYEFQETAQYGASKERTTVKNRILRALQSQCEYQNARQGYSSDHNAFTNAINNIVAAQMKLYKPQFDKEVNAIFVKEAMEYAQKSIREKLGIK